MFWWECWWVSGRVCCASGSGDGDVGVGNNSGSADNSGDCGGDSCGHFGDCGKNLVCKCKFLMQMIIVLQRFA